MRPFGAAFLEVLMSHDSYGSGVWARGRTVVELLIVLCVTGMLTVAGLPVLAEARRAAALREATFRISGLMFRCRAHAIMRMRATSLLFEREGGSGWRCYIAEDGDGDGVRRADLESGRDRIIGEVLHVEGATAGLGIITRERVPDPGGRGALGGNLDDPVRAGRGDIITFTPRSTATPSSVYFTDYHSRMRVLRVYGGTGRVNSLVWRSGWKEWRKSGL
jgi:type II secretory pathway pseudopilin PulG